MRRAATIAARVAGFDLFARCAWPSGDWGSLPIEGGIEVAYKAELAAAADRDESSRRSRSPQPGPFPLSDR